MLVDFRLQAIAVDFRLWKVAGQRIGMIRQEMVSPVFSSLAPAFLLSMPQMADPNFARSVVLLCKHTSEDGAFGPARRGARSVGVADERRRWGSDVQHTAREAVGSGDPPLGRRSRHAPDVARRALSRLHEIVAAFPSRS